MSSPTDRQTAAGGRWREVLIGRPDPSKLSIGTAAIDKVNLTDRLPQEAGIDRLSLLITK